MADLSKIVDELSSLTVLEAAELSKLLEEKWGVDYLGVNRVVAVLGMGFGSVIALAIKAEADVAELSEEEAKEFRRELGLPPQPPAERLLQEIVTLLGALLRLRDGDPSVRLPVEWTGVVGKVAEVFNEVAEQNARMALQVANRGYVIQTGEVILSDTAANLRETLLLRLRNGVNCVLSIARASPSSGMMPLSAAYMVAPSE